MSSTTPATTPSQPEVTACRNCGRAVYLHHRSTGPQPGGTGPTMSEHWRHVEDDARHCRHGNGHLAEQYDGSGNIAELLRSRAWFGKEGT